MQKEKFGQTVLEVIFFPNKSILSHPSFVRFFANQLDIKGLCPSAPRSCPVIQLSPVVSFIALAVHMLTFQKGDGGGGGGGRERKRRHREREREKSEIVCV